MCQKVICYSFVCTFQDALKQQKEKPGPCEGGDCLHELLHSEGDIIHRSHDKIGPEQQKKPGPEEGMEYLHGVLMHGDEKPGVTHKVILCNLIRILSCLTSVQDK